MLVRTIYFYIFILCAVNAANLAGAVTKEQVDSVNALYGYEYIVSNTHKAIKILSRNLEDAKSIDYEEGIALTYTRRGLAYYINGKYDETTEDYIAAIKLYEKLGNIDQQASLYGEFGYQLKRRDMEKANRYMRMGIKIAESYKLGYFTTNKLYSNYGVLKEMEDDLDSAMYFYQKSLKMNLEYNDSLGLPYTYNKIAGIKAMQGNYDKAFTYMKMSDEIRAKEDGDFGRAENLSMYGDILSSQKRLTEAIAKYKECLTLAKNIGYKYLVQDSSQKLKELFEKTGNYKEALYYYDHYTDYTDSLSNLETNSRIAELEIDYETEKKDRIIVENKLELEEKSRIIFAASGIAMILALAALGIYKYQKQKREREKQELELKTKLKEAEIENKLSSEKLRISRELHDNIGSQLTFIISSLDNLTYLENNEKTVSKLNRLSSFGRDTMKELRNTIWAMNHEDGDLSSLIARLNELIQNINLSSDGFRIFVTNEVTDPIKLSSARMLAIFRIVQEAVQNAIKYAEANKVQIIFNKHEKGILLQIEDDGCGFDIESVKKGNGLSNMKFRCEEAGGKFSINSGSAGTLIQCVFNLN